MSPSGEFGIVDSSGGVNLIAVAGGAGTGSGATASSGRCGCASAAKPAKTTAPRQAAARGDAQRGRDFSTDSGSSSPTSMRRRFASGAVSGAAAVIVATLRRASSW